MSAANTTAKPTATTRTTSPSPITTTTKSPTAATTTNWKSANVNSGTREPNRTDEYSNKIRKCKTLGAGLTQGLLSGITTATANIAAVYATAASTPLIPAPPPKTIAEAEALAATKKVTGIGGVGVGVGVGGGKPSVPTTNNNNQTLTSFKPSTSPSSAAQQLQRPAIGTKTVTTTKVTNVTQNTENCSPRKGVTITKTTRGPSVIAKLQTAIPAPAQVIRKVKFSTTFGTAKHGRRNSKTPRNTPKTAVAVGASSTASSTGQTAESRAKGKSKSILKVSHFLVGKTREATLRQLDLLRRQTEQQEREELALERIARQFAWKLPPQSSTPIIKAVDVNAKAQNNFENNLKLITLNDNQIKAENPSSSAAAAQTLPTHHTVPIVYLKQAHDCTGDKTACDKASSSHSSPPITTTDDGIIIVHKASSAISTTSSSPAKSQISSHLRHFSPVPVERLGLFSSCFPHRSCIYSQLSKEKLPGNSTSSDNLSLANSFYTLAMDNNKTNDESNKKKNDNGNDKGNSKGNGNDVNDSNNNKNNNNDNNNSNSNNNNMTSLNNNQSKSKDNMDITDDNAPSTSNNIDNGSSLKRKINEETSAKTSSDAAAAAGPSTSTQPAEEDKDKEEDKDAKKKKNRCAECRKKVGLTGFQCRCGGLYCAVHRYSDKHDCTFNYREHGAQEIRRNNPVVVGEKIQKI